MDETLERFDEVADDYGSFVEKIPKYNLIVKRILEVLDQWDREQSPRRVAELGVGTGGIAEKVLERFRPEGYLGVDAVESMLEVARSRLEDHEDVSVEFECSDFESWKPTANYDWIYSNLSIHHLRDFEKQDLFKRVRTALTPGGSFLLSDLVRIPEKRYDLYRSIYWDRLRSLGFEDAEIEERWQQHRRNDRPADLRASLRWLRDVGFSTVECVWKDFNRAILIASKRS